MPPRLLMGSLVAGWPRPQLGGPPALASFPQMSHLTPWAPGVWSPQLRGTHVRVHVQTQHTHVNKGTHTHAHAPVQASLAPTDGQRRRVSGLLKEAAEQGAGRRGEAGFGRRGCCVERRSGLAPCRVHLGFGERQTPRVTTDASEARHPGTLTFLRRVDDGARCLRPCPTPSRDAVGV